MMEVNLIQSFVIGGLVAAVIVLWRTVDKLVIRLAIQEFRFEQISRKANTVDWTHLQLDERDASWVDWSGGSG
ncbi:hypothetical protein D3C84_1246740 [compost metagenome]